MKLILQPRHESATSDFGQELAERSVRLEAMGSLRGE